MNQAICKTCGQTFDLDGSSHACPGLEPGLPLEDIRALLALQRPIRQAAETIGQQRGEIERLRKTSWISPQVTVLAQHGRDLVPMIVRNIESAPGVVRATVIPPLSMVGFPPETAPRQYGDGSTPAERPWILAEIQDHEQLSMPRFMVVAWDGPHAKWCSKGIMGLDILRWWPLPPGKGEV